MVYEGYRVVGILPLVRTGGTVQFTGGLHADYNDFICEQKSAERTLTAAFAALIKFLPETTCVMRKIREDSHIVRHRDRLPPYLQQHLQLEPGSRCPTILLNDNGFNIIDELLLKSSLRKDRRKLEKTGRVSFQHLESRSEILSYLPDYFQQHTERWAITGERGLFVEVAPRLFYEALIAELDPRSQLRFGVLKIDERPIAYHFGFESKRKFVLYKPSFDLDYWDYSPGKVLLGYLLQYAKRCGLREFDFSIGNEAYKQRFANYTAQTFTLRLEKSPYTIQSHVGRHARKLKRRVREMPQLAAFVKRLANCASRMRSFLTTVIRWGREQDRSVGLKAIPQPLLARRTEVLVFRVNPARELQQLTVRRGTLRDLAALAIEFAGFAAATNLQTCRERMRSGHKVFISRDDAGVSHLVWASERGDIPLTVAGDVVLPLKSSGVLIEEMWSRSGCGSISATISATVNELAAQKPQAELWYRQVYANDTTKTGEFSRANFNLECRTLELRVLGIRVWRRIACREHSVAPDFDRSSRTVPQNGQAA